MKLLRTLNLILLLSGIFISTSALAAWQLVPAKSSIHFISVKNSTVSEVHQFEKIKGTIEKDGKVEILIPLASIKTNIDIRDERIKNTLFDLEKYPNATISTVIDPNAVKKLKIGESMSMSLTVIVNFNGMDVPFPVSAEVVKLENNNLQVTATSPVMANTEMLNLKEGIEMLRRMAGLKEISLMVPVGFKLVFMPITL